MGTHLLPTAGLSRRESGGVTGRDGGSERARDRGGSFTNPCTCEALGQLGQVLTCRGLAGARCERVLSVRTPGAQHRRFSERQNARGPRLRLHLASQRVLPLQHITGKDTRVTQKAARTGAPFLCRPVRGVVHMCGRPGTGRPLPTSEEVLQDSAVGLCLGPCEVPRWGGVV